MEIAQPHVVVRSFGPGIGRDLVAALGVHAVEVSEARDRSDACRVAAGRGATVVIVTDAADAGGAVAEVRELFPGVPILLCPGPPGAGPPLAGAGDAIGTIPASASLPEICWHVLAAIARWAGRPGITEHTIGPFALAVDAAGIVCPMPPSLGCLIMDGRRLRPGDSLLSVVAPPDRAAVGDALGRAGDGHPQFLTLRILDTGGSPHAVLAGFRPAAGGRVAVLIQPLVFAGQIGGRHADVRDPITGLLTRWEMSRRLEVEERSTAPDTSAALVLVRLDVFSEIADRLGHADEHGVGDRKSTRLNSSHAITSRMPSSA